jgi:hypothetical protein
MITMCRLSFDESRINSVLLNATKHTQGRTVISVSTGYNVRREGVGMNAEIEDAVSRDC